MSLGGSVLNHLLKQIQPKQQRNTFSGGIHPTRKSNPMSGLGKFGKHSYAPSVGTDPVRLPTRIQSKHGYGSVTPAGHQIGVPYPTPGIVQPNDSRYRKPPEFPIQDNSKTYEQSHQDRWLQYDKDLYDWEKEMGYPVNYQYIPGEYHPLPTYDPNTNSYS